MAPRTADVRRARYQPPAAPSDLVRRPRLISRLDHGATLPLTVVHAPGGYGKTTLLAAWANATAHPCAWVSIGPEDDDPVALASALCAAIDRVLPGRLSGMAPLLRSADPDPAALGAALSAALDALAEPVSVVIDGASAIAAPGAQAVLAALLAKPAQGVNVVLGCRGVPPISAIAKLRRQGLVEDIGERDLRFSMEEAEALVTPNGASASAADLRRAIKATGGWPAGVRALRLRGAHGQGHDDGLPAGDEDHVREVIERVLAGESAASLDLLTATAMLDQVSAPLADALLDEPAPGASQAVLEDLLQRHVFVSGVTGDRSWFNVHHLLRDELLARLRSVEGEEGLRARNLRASSWFEAQGDIDRAVRHALDAGSVDLAADLVERHALDVVERGPWQSAGLLLRRLPREVVHRRPALLALLANLLSEDGRIADAEATLDELEALLAASPELDDPAVRAEIDGVRAYDRLASGDPRLARPFAERGLANPAAPAHVVGNLTNVLAIAAQLDGRADEGIAGLERLIDRNEPRPGIASAIAGASLGIVQMRAERFEDAARTARWLASSIEGSSHYAPEYGAALVGLLAYLRGDVERALGYLRPAAATATWVFSRTETAMALALALHAAGDAAGARETAERLVRDASSPGPTPWSVVAESFHASLAAMAGDREAADRWLAANERTAFAVPASLVEDPRLTRAALRLARGRAGDVEAAVSEASAVMEWARETHNGWTEGQALAVLALALDAAGDREAALDALASALSGERASLHRRFLDRGPAMLDLLEALKAQADEELAGAARAVLAAGGRVDPPPVATRLKTSKRFGKRLSPREREVLALLGEGLSNEVIAARLGIAIETVKQHASAIYEKYGIRSRRQAGAIARRIAAGETVEPGA